MLKLWFDETFYIEKFPFHTKNVLSNIKARLKVLDIMKY